jgi:hypothetical protein
MDASMRRIIAGDVTRLKRASFLVAAMPGSDTYAL